MGFPPLFCPIEAACFGDWRWADAFWVYGGRPSGKHVGHAATYIPQEGGGGSAHSKLQLFGGGRRPIVVVVVIELRRAGGAYNRYRSYFFWVKVAEVFAPKRGSHTYTHTRGGWNEGFN